MVDQGSETPFQTDIPPQGRAEKETLDGETSFEALQQCALSARRTEGTLRDTIRIPRTNDQLTQINEDDFKQYILGMTDAAIALIMNTVEHMVETEDIDFYKKEFRKKLPINGSFNALSISQFISTRLKYVDALKAIISADAEENEDSKNLSQAKDMLEEINEKLQQWIRVR